MSLPHHSSFSSIPHIASCSPSFFAPNKKIYEWQILLTLNHLSGWIAVFILVLCYMCQNMVGNWAWPEEAGETKCPPTKNRILGHIILRLRNIAHPPTLDSPSPSFTHFTLKACVLGKQYSGKTTCLARIAEGTTHIQIDAHACMHTSHYLITHLTRRHMKK